jgi:type IV pilus assembly protein PilY1
MWNGNIKKFIIAQPEGYLSDCPYNPDFAIGEVLDVNCNKALNDDGTISSASTSLWVTKSPDGSDVEVGGIGGILKNQSTREIYTYFKLDTNLTVASNEFDTDISPDLFGLGSDTTARDKLVNFIYGQDAYDEDADTNTTEKRHWILGSFLHSRPLVIHYGSLASRPSVIYAGGNDGMLHAFDDTTGEEIWGFVPLDQLIRLQALSLPTSKDTPFVDGSPKAYVNYEYNADGSIKAVNEAILIFGERRGGNRYYALDVTNPSVPKFLWYISKDERVYGTTTFASDYGQLGQSWSTPAIGKIACQETDPHAILVGDKWVKWVVFIGGGYDTNQDNNPLTEADDEGRAVYVIDIKDGSLVKAFVHDTGDYSSMDYCIPSDITKLDVDGNGNVDRLYVGDLGGQMWRFDIGDLVPANWTGRIIFQSNPGKDTSTGRKIFYPPDVTLEKGDYEMLVFGTGDRENPQEENVSNRIYALKDKNLTGTILNENDLYDVTGNELQTTTDPATRNAILSALNAAYGWWITLGTGEKSLAAPIVYYRAAYLTTFIPTATDDPCQARFGTARMYVLNYSNGMAVLNLDGSLDNVISTTDRSESIGTAIPSGVIITFIGGTTVAYTGVGGGVNSPPLTTTKSIFPMTWRIVF